MTPRCFAKKPRLSRRRCTDKEQSSGRTANNLVPFICRKPGHTLSTKKVRLVPDFLVRHLNSGTFGDQLQWMDYKLGIFRIYWQHQASSHWEPLRDGAVFKEWAVIKNLWNPGDPKSTVKAKQRLRSALFRLPNVKFVKREANYRIYQITDINEIPPFSVFSLHLSNVDSTPLPPSDVSLPPSNADSSCSNFVSQTTPEGMALDGISGETETNLESLEEIMNPEVLPKWEIYEHESDLSDTYDNIPYYINLQQQCWSDTDNFSTFSEYGCANKLLTVGFC